VAEHVRALAAATDLPLSVDLENGYGPAPSDAARAVERVAAAGAVGASIEDYDPDGSIYPVEQARRAGRRRGRGARSLDFPFTLTARAENHIRGQPRPRRHDRPAAGLPARRRGRALRARAGGRRGDPRRVRGRVAPVNVLARPGLSRDEIAAGGRAPDQRRRRAVLGRRGRLRRRRPSGCGTPGDFTGSAPRGGCAMAGVRTTCRGATAAGAGGARRACSPALGALRLLLGHLDLGVLVGLLDEQLAAVQPNAHVTSTSAKAMFQAVTASCWPSE
jgi:hypothetical protein